jgi:TolB-like protein/tRNA A-37 threonylcarbamoyl transferase component Bud32
VVDLRQQLQTDLAERYQLDRELGRGGMATVFLAHDLRHDRRVALKVLHPELAATLGPERFQREIRTTARLQHPHILPVLDSGDAAAQLWYTMPYVEGESLRERLRREGQLPLDDALQITREVSDALSYAHSQGIVHRDIKPENILLSQGHALVADFGIARAVQQGDAEQLTATGMAIGTLAYMSPEQASGGSAVDGRSDLYSLGCVLYEMLAGEVPYTGATPQALIAKRLREPLPHVRTVRESVPAAVEQAINRALAPMAADRFATVVEFVQALAQPVSSVATTPTPAMPQGRRRPRVAALAAALALLMLLGLGVLGLWRSRAERGAAGAKRLAVLPFENLGRPEDEYFADGVTDEVRGKLAALPGLEVIARASSGEYKQTTKRPQQIGRELGVDYLLTGTVRWEKAVGGPSRVRVSPELVQVSTASTKWQVPFEAPLTDVFRVQADVAARVAEALGLALGAGEREQLAERPTENLAAYDAFLKGEEALGGMADLAAFRRALDYYERAVALDSTFALAWAKLSLAHSRNYCGTPTAAGGAIARRAADHALEFAPNLPESRRASQLAPKNALFLTVVAQNELALGHAEEGLKYLQEAQVLDPRSVETATRAVHALFDLHRYPEALQTADRGLALAPASLGLIHAKLEVYLAQGDLPGGREVLRAVPREVDPAALVAFIASWDDLYWVLDDEQQRLLLRLSPAPFGDDRAAWAFALAETHMLRGDTALARAYADSSRLVLEARLQDVPQDAVTHAWLGLALAYMGRKTEARREGERALEFVPVSTGPMIRAGFQRQLARTYLLVGELERALDLLEPLLRSHYLSPGWLRIDPTYAALRGNPRFERLVRGT